MSLPAHSLNLYKFDRQVHAIYFKKEKERLGWVCSQPWFDDQHKCWCIMSRW